MLRFNIKRPLIPRGRWRAEIAIVDEPGQAENSVKYSIAAGADKSLKCEESFKLDRGELTWTIGLANQGDQPLEIGDLALPLSMAEGTPRGRGQIYTQKLIRHAFIAGNGSWTYWQRANAEGPFLVMVPQGKTKIEFTGRVADPNAPPPVAGPIRGWPRRFRLHAVHSCVGFERRPDQTGPGRRSRTALAAANQQTRTRAERMRPTILLLTAFKFAWAKDFDGVRDVLYKLGSIDVNIVPGMSLPTDLPAMIRCARSTKSTKCCRSFLTKPKSNSSAKKAKGSNCTKCDFSRLGENMLTVKYGDGQWSTLQFFITEPLETVISKRSSFLVNSMQHNDPSQWWNGVYSDWDQLHKVLRSPIDRDGLSPWLTDASDDAGNARPAYVAAKNVFFPDQKEIDSVERYIRQYLFNGNKWTEGTGGMQMTEKEPYPYGIYGTFDNWYQHRTISPTPPANFVPQTQTLPHDIGWTRLHRDHLWRIYDYPTSC